MRWSADRLSACTRPRLPQALLFRGRLNINAPNHRGDTPLHIAARWGFAKLVRLLVENGGLSSCRNVRNETPLHCAHSKDIVAILQQTSVLAQDSARVMQSPESLSARQRANTARAAATVATQSTLHGMPDSATSSAASLVHLDRQAAEVGSWRPSVSVPASLPNQIEPPRAPSEPPPIMDAEARFQSLSSLPLLRPVPSKSSRLFDDDDDDEADLDALAIPPVVQLSASSSVLDVLMYM